MVFKKFKMKKGVPDEPPIKSISHYRDVVQQKRERVESLRIAKDDEDAVSSTATSQAKGAGNFSPRPSFTTSQGNGSGYYISQRSIATSQANGYAASERSSAATRQAIAKPPSSTFSRVAFRYIVPLICVASLITNAYLLYRFQLSNEELNDTRTMFQLSNKELNVTRAMLEEEKSANSDLQEMLQQTLSTNKGSTSALFFGSSNHERVDAYKLLQSFVTADFAIYVAAYYAYYLFMVGAVTAIAVFVYKVDYIDIESRQLTREVIWTLQSYTAIGTVHWITLQAVPFWSTDTSLFRIATSFVVNSLVFSCWSFVSHKIWNSNQAMYTFVQEYQQRSMIVCPLTALASAWPESMWTSIGFAIGPLFLGTTNVWAFYLSIFSIVGEAVLWNSQIPFTLVSKNHYGFLADFIIWLKSKGQNLFRRRSVIAPEIAEKAAAWNRKPTPSWEYLDEEEDSTRAGGDAFVVRI